MAVHFFNVFLGSLMASSFFPFFIDSYNVSWPISGSNFFLFGGLFLVTELRCDHKLQIKTPRTLISLYQRLRNKKHWLKFSSSRRNITFLWLSNGKLHSYCSFYSRRCQQKKIMQGCMTVMSGLDFSHSSASFKAQPN